jgi:ribonuclease Z
VFEILFLGTSASAPSARRGLSAQIVKHDEYRFLIDCGEGTQRQILQSGIGFKQITRILLTHGHLDHILGLGGLMSTFMRWEAIEELEIFGGKNTLDRVRTLINDVVLRGANPPMPLHFREIGPGSLFETDDFTVTAFPVTHRGPDCLGYLFCQRKRRNWAFPLARSGGCWWRANPLPWRMAAASLPKMCSAPFSGAPN